jgi:AraC-like DNA-binding protein/mannose-6-phosphate isomerase-like protein (cupin superfamily)
MDKTDKTMEEMAEPGAAGGNKRRHIAFERPGTGVHPVPRFLRIGRLRGPHRYDKPEHPHQEHEWLLVRKGRLRVWLDGSPLEVAPGDLYFVQPGQTHRELSLEEPLDFYALRFHLHDLRGRTTHFIQPPGEPERQCLRKADPAFARLFEEIFQEVWKNQPGAEEVVEGILLQMVWLARRALNLLPAQEPLGRRQSQAVETARQFLAANLGRNVSLSELGSACCVSPDRLRHVFKEVTGVSPKQYIAALRVEEAKRLLAGTSLTISEIARRVGCEDAFYFSRLFKKATGGPPQSWRQPLVRNDTRPGRRS